MAGQIPPQFIDELLARVDIVDVIDSRVPLKKAGKNLQACCPFHNEKSPSFTVSPEKQFYHCFGCGAHGTAIGFLMEYDQLNFPETIQELADIVGMQVPVNQSVSQTPVQQNLYDLLDKASQYYIHQLQTHPHRQLFVDYLQKRGLSSKTVEMYGIGMAPDGWDNVLKILGANPQLVKQLTDAGLLIKNDKGRIYDRFRHRLMFPILDRRGRTIGFGGRVLDDSTPKYLNSPETPVFHKGSELYGLYQAKKNNRKIERILIVEGYMDVIALAEHGITNAVATLGTSTTTDHLRLLMRSTPEIVFCFDGDNAGRDAAWRAAENALPMLGGNQQLKFMFLPDGEDPDSIVKSSGAEGFNQHIDSAQNFSEFFFTTLTNKLDLSSMDGRARLVEMTKPYLKHVPQGVYRDMLEEQLAELTKTNKNTLNKHLETPKSAKRPAKKSAALATMTPIRMAISIVLQYPILAREIDDARDLASLEQPGVNILRELLETLHHHPHLTTAALLERWRDRENSAHLQKLALQNLSLSADALKHELIGIYSQLQNQAKQQRRIYLEAKPLSELTDAEKMELRSS